MLPNLSLYVSQEAEHGRYYLDGGETVKLSGFGNSNAKLIYEPVSGLSLEAGVSNLFDKTTTIKLATQKKDASISAISDINSKIKNGQLGKNRLPVVFIKLLIFQRFNFPQSRLWLNSHFRNSIHEHYRRSPTLLYCLQYLLVCNRRLSPINPVKYRRLNVVVYLHQKKPPNPLKLNHQYCHTCIQIVNWTTFTF